jgi:peptidoglycan/xylan/chitin deacetylase (PgdA/CDA1 family)
MNLPTARIVALLLLLCLAAAAFRPPAAAAISRVPTTVPVVALTFDDGPSVPYTGRILDLLLQAHARATFFVLGDEAARYPDVVRRLAHAGMELGLHGLTHRDVRQLGARQAVAQALAERDLLRRLVPGLPVTLFRPPYGAVARGLAPLLARNGLDLVLWDVDTLDWTRPAVAAIVRRVERAVRPGSIVLFHDGGGNRQETVEAVRRLLPWFATRGYRLVTVSQLVEFATPAPAPISPPPPGSAIFRGER